MRVTTVTIDAEESRARVTLAAGTIVPRLIERGPRSARIALVAGGALLLGGDRIDITIRVGDGCTLDLEDIGGTVAYAADGIASFWDADITLGTRARLRWAGLPLIVAHGADVHRTTRIRLGRDSIALVRETVVLGRTGEQGGRVRLRSSVADLDGPILEEHVEADGAYPIPGVLNTHRVLDTILCTGHRPESRPTPGITVMPLTSPGTLARFLGTATHHSPLATTWDDWRTLPATTEDAVSVRH